MTIYPHSSASQVLALLFVAVTTVTADLNATQCNALRYHKTGFWDIDIDNHPVLPRECGPPLSRNSDRNIDHLPYQIAAICGSYVACAIGVGLAILTIRRKRKSLVAPEPVELKLVHNESRKFEPPPSSPAASFASWMRNPLRKKVASGVTFTSGDGGLGDLNSPGMASIASFDNTILDKDRESRQAEMDRLYAAVMVHDAARRSQVSQVQRGEPSLNSSQMPRESLASLGRPADRRLQRVAHLDIRPPQSPTTSGVPQTPIRAIYPPSHDIPDAPLSPTSPIRATVPDEYWPQPGRQALPLRNQKSQQSMHGMHGMQSMQTMSNIYAGPLSPNMPLSPTTPKIELPNDMYPASPPPGGRRMRLPSHVGQAFPLSPGGPVTPISPAPMSAAMFATMGPASPRYPLPNDMYPASPPLQSNPMTLPPPMPFAEPVRRPASTRSFGSRLETESITSNKSSKGRRMIKNMRINTGVNNDDMDAEERAPLSAGFQGENQQLAKDSSNSNTPDTPESTELEDRFEALNSTMPSQPQTRLGTPPRRPTHLNLQNPPSHSRKPSLSSINTSFGGHVGLPSSPAPSHRSIGLPSGPRPNAPTSFPLPSSASIRSMNAPTPARSPAPTATAPGGSKPLALRVQFGDNNGMLSPAPVKTTFLERRKEALGRGAKTPRTGMIPQTPYSAYMPFTPMTPVTPRLVSRHERKQKKKEMGKALMADSDLVKEDEEEWD
jgi:hypothetical protein